MSKYINYDAGDVLPWLRRTRRRDFTWTNTGCGCLFTQFVRRKTGDSKVYVDIEAQVVKKNKYGDAVSIGAVLCHDSFWDTVELLQPTRPHSVTRTRAIKILQSLSHPQPDKAAK